MTCPVCGGVFNLRYEKQLREECPDHPMNWETAMRRARVLSIIFELRYRVTGHRDHGGWSYGLERISPDEARWIPSRTS